MQNYWSFFMLFIGAVVWQGCSTSGNPAQPAPPDESEEMPTPTQPSLSDSELMEVVQETTFQYFWDYAEPNSGLARERSNGSSTTVTTGGSGFGIATFPAAVERGWITREEAITRLQKILDFLEQVPTYHGAFSHWYNGLTKAPS